MSEISQTKTDKYIDSLESILLDYINRYGLTEKARLELSRAAGELQYEKKGCGASSALVADQI